MNHEGGSACSRGTSGGHASPCVSCLPATYNGKLLVVQYSHRTIQHSKKSVDMYELIYSLHHP